MTVSPHLASNIVQSRGDLKNTLGALSHTAMTMPTDQDVLRLYLCRHWSGNSTIAEIH